MDVLEHSAVDRTASAAPWWSVRWSEVVLAGVGVLGGLSGLAGGYYDISQWGPATLVLLVVLIVCLFASPGAGLRPFFPGLAGLGGLCVWAILSGTWAEFPDAAIVEGDRWGLYFLCFGILATLVRRRRDALAVLAGAAAGVLVVAGWVLAHMLAGADAQMFLGGRLNQPMGYVNSMANLFLIGAWPLIALAEARRKAWLSGLAVGLAAALGALVVLCESRGALVATAASVAILVLTVPGRQRRVWILLAVGVALAAIYGPLVAVYHSGGQPGEARHAAKVILLAGACVAALWTLGDGALTRLIARRPDRARTTSRLGLILLLTVFGAVTVVALASAGTIAHRVRTQARAFTQVVPLAEGPGTTRLFAGAGNRYDYWRVALKEFRSAPVKGLGAGNYDRDYFRERKTSEDIRQPHSIELQTLAELGLVGGLLLLVFLGATLIGLVRLHRPARRDSFVRIVAVGGGGVFLVWLSQTSVDWMHLMPGPTVLALAGAVVVTRSWVPASEATVRPRRVRAVAVAVAVSFALVLGFFVIRPTLASHLRAESQQRLARDPLSALRQASSALSLDGGSLESAYLKAAALARLNQYHGARNTLIDAATSHPSAWVPWALLGDLATRRGDRRGAQVAYRHALRLNPRDPGLIQLTRCGGTPGCG